MLREANCTYETVILGPPNLEMCLSRNYRLEEDERRIPRKKTIPTGRRLDYEFIRFHEQKYEHHATSRELNKSDNASFQVSPCHAMGDADFVDRRALLAVTKLAAQIFC